MNNINTHSLARTGLARGVAHGARTGGVAHGGVARTGLARGEGSGGDGNP